MVEYSATTCEATGLGKRLIHSKGFLPNSIVVVKPGKTNEGSIYKIKSIDDEGNVKLKAMRNGVEVAEGLLKAKCDLFLDKHELTKLSMSSIMDFPNNDVANRMVFPSLHVETLSSIVMTQLYKQHSPIQVLIREKTAKVEAASAFAKIN